MHCSKWFLEDCGHLEVILDGGISEGLEVAEVDPEDDEDVGCYGDPCASHSVGGVEDKGVTEGPEEGYDDVVSEGIGGVLEGSLVFGEVLDGELGGHLYGADGELHGGEEDGLADDLEGIGGIGFTCGSSKMHCFI
jgi:hypothetical protein